MKYRDGGSRILDETGRGSRIFAAVYRIYHRGGGSRRFAAVYKI